MPLSVLLLAQTVSATVVSSPADIAVAVKPSLALATLSDAMNGAGMEELNHEIYGGVYSQMIHGESFEEPTGVDGVSGQRFTNTWSASRGHLGDDGNSSYLTWQPAAPSQPGCSFNVSSTALNGNRSQRVSCNSPACSCAIINRGVDATGFTFDGATSLEGYLFALLPTHSSGGADVSVAVELIDEAVRGHCGSRCPVLAGQTITLDPTATGRWQRLNISLSGLKGATRCTNGSGIGPSLVRCVGQYGGGNPKYFPVEGHMFEEDVCLTCSGSVRLRVESKAGATVLLDQFFLSPSSVYGGDLARLPARLDVGKSMEQAWQALRFGGGTADGATYRWKQWRGPRWLRPPMANRAYAWHTNGFMAFETLELAETLGLNETVIDLNEHETSEDCADFVEYVYGPTTSKMGAVRKLDGRAEPFKPFRVELGNEEPCSAQFVANVARCASAMISKARELKLPFKLKFAVGGPYEIAELTDRAMAPMVQALKPLKDHSDWIWDFHINGQSRGLIFELHKQPRTARNLTNAEYHQCLLDNFTRWQRFFDEPSSGKFFKCGVFEQNGGTHDMGRALGNARNSVTLQSLGNSVRLVTGANALQLMGHNDGGWDQGQIMVTPNASILTPYGQSNRLLKETFQSTVVQSRVVPMDAMNNSECFFLATRNDSALNLRIVNLNTSSIRVFFSWAKDTCLSAGGDSAAATVRVLSADSLEAVNTPAQPDLVSIVDGAPLPIVNNSVEYLAPKFSISVITVAVDCIAVGVLKTDDSAHEKRITCGGRYGWSVSGQVCPPPQWEPRWAMNLSTVTESAANITGFYDAEKASQWGVITIDWQDGAALWQDALPGHTGEEVLTEQCKRIKAQGTGTRCMVYRQNELAVEWQESSRAAMTQANADAGWFLKFKTRALCESAADCNDAAYHNENGGGPLIPCKKPATLSEPNCAYCCNFTQNGSTGVYK
jgi:alpha-L-arabinofuranosidase